MQPRVLDDFIDDCFLSGDDICKINKDTLISVHKKVTYKLAFNMVKI